MKNNYNQGMISLFYHSKRFFMPIRSCITFILFSVLTASIAYAAPLQEIRVTIQKKNISLNQVFKEIEKQTGCSFLVRNNDVNISEKVSINARNKTVEQILEILFTGKNIKYEVEGKRITIYKPIEQIQGKVSNSVRKVVGRVMDSNAEPIIGASVMVDGTSNGTITDVEGRFFLEVPADAKLLKVTYIGYSAQTVAIGNKTTIDISMKEDMQVLDEVVVVGYGTQKKVNLTGSVTSVDFSKQIESRPVTNVSSALAGLMPGVSVRQTSGMPGEDGATIRVRGVGTLNNSAPLVIVDGVESLIDVVNPADVETITVLKDAASCAIYGSRAANGVILVTTKKGNTNSKINVTYSGHISLAQPSNLMEVVNDYPTYMRLVNEGYNNLGRDDLFSPYTIEAWEEANKNPNATNELGIPNYVAYPNTNWSKEMFQNNLIQEHSLSVNGGNDKVRFLLSASYLDNPGLVENTGLKRYSVRMNVEADVNKWLAVGTRTYASQQSREPNDFGEANKLLLSTTPGIYPRWNGKYGYVEAPEENPQANNILQKLNTLHGSNMVSRFSTTLYSKIKIWKGLSWDFNFTYSRRFDENDTHTKTTERVKFSDGTVMESPKAADEMTTSFTNAGEKIYDLENILRYQTIVAKDHDISLLAGYSERYGYSYSRNATKRGLIDENIYAPSTATEMQSIGGTANDNAIRSFFGRVNYDYKSRYLFEANLRYDGSSRFAKESRWGIFPSFSAGWRLSEESFFKEYLGDKIDNLKIRASWGRLGNNSVGDYDYQALYSKTNNVLGGTISNGLVISKWSNSLLHWEKTAIANIGIDGAFLKGRLTTEVDFYNKFTDGILYTPSIYLTMGTASGPSQNIAEVTNRGMEMNLGWRDNIGKVNYSISGNFTYNHNEVTKYRGKLKRGWEVDENGNRVYVTNLGEVSNGSNTRILEGHPINEYYLMRLHHGSGENFLPDGTVNPIGGPRDGMIRTKNDMEWLQAMISAGYKFLPSQQVKKDKIWYGDLIYADLDGDKTFGGTNDYNFTGSSSNPKYLFGLNASVSWKGIDFSMVWAGAAGFDLYWNSVDYNYNQSIVKNGKGVSKMIAEDHYYYNENNASASISNNVYSKNPRLVESAHNQNTQPSTFYLYKGNYLKLKNLTIGYSLPRSWMSRLSLQSVRFYLSGENLLTITSYPGIDPEQGAVPGYTTVRQFTFGTNITF